VFTERSPIRHPRFGRLPSCLLTLCVLQEGQGVHQYYSLTILEDEAKKSKESLEAMLENMIFEKWNASQWSIVGL
jgi:hypothetical protein